MEARTVLMITGGIALVLVVLAALTTPSSRAAPATGQTGADGVAGQHGPEQMATGSATATAAQRAAATVPSVALVIPVDPPWTRAVAVKPERIPPDAAEPDGPEPPPPAGLAADAGAADVLTWIVRTSAGLDGENVENWGDPRMAILGDVPPARYDVLVHALDDPKISRLMRIRLDHYAVSATRAKDRELVLASIAKHPALIEAVVRKGWCALAAPTVRTWLAGKPVNYQTIGWGIEVLVRVGDEHDVPLLRDLLVHSPFGYWKSNYARRLERMPGLDIDAAVQAAWTTWPAQQNYQMARDAFALMAVRHGVRAAWPRLIVAATGDGWTDWQSGSNAALCQAWLTVNFDVGRHAEDIHAWWAVAKDALTWDAQAEQWNGPQAPPEARPRPRQLGETPAPVPDPRYDY